jgi:hypothetical protein
MLHLLSHSPLNPQPLVNQTHKKGAEVLDIWGNGWGAGYGEYAVCEGGVTSATTPTAGIGFRDPPQARNWTAPRSY